MTGHALVLSCEHAGNRVPARFAHVFATARARAALHSHRGHDPGAFALARKLARALRLPLHACTRTRLLIEPNRSIGHPQLFSEFSAGLEQSEREALQLGYLRHWQAVEAAVRARLRGPRPLLHLAVHSFTPRLHGETRRADVGLLYDPRHSTERVLCARLQAELRGRFPELRVRRNYPYRGDADGLTTQLRRRLGPRYLGVELEINQALLLGPPAPRKRLANALVETLAGLAGQSARTEIA